MTPEEQALLDDLNQDENLSRDISLPGSTIEVTEVKPEPIPQFEIPADGTAPVAAVEPVSQEPAAPEASPEAVQPTPEETRASKLQDLYAGLQDKYNKNQNTSEEDFSRLQDKRDLRQLGTNLSEGLATMASGINDGKIDNAFYNNLRKQADQPIIDLKEKRARYAQQLEVNEKLLNTAEKLAKNATEEELDNPANPRMKTLKALLESQSPKLVKDLKEKGAWDSMTLRDVDTFFKEADNAYQREFEAKKLQNDSVSKDLELQKKKVDLEAAKVKLEEAKNPEDTESKKEDIQIKKENRKMRTELDAAETKLAEQLRFLKASRDEFLKYSKNSAGGTGPLATGFGAKRFLDQDLEALNSKFKKISLDEMIKMFQGMSRAVDSDSERRAFESTQPSITLDDKTNMQILGEKIKAAESLLQKTKDAKEQYDRTGAFRQSASTAENQDAQTVSNQETPAQSSSEQPVSTSEIRRKTKDGKIAIFDENKNFLRYE